MPTKLKKPITIVFDSVEDAVSACNRFDIAPSFVRERLGNNRFIYSGGPQFHLIDKALKSEGIDYATYQPPAPLKAAEYEVKILDNGDLKVGCQTITRDQMERIVSEWSKTTQPKEEEWPKFYYDGTYLLRLNNARDYGIWLHSNAHDDEQSNLANLQYVKERPEFKQITRAEASKILGREI